MVGEVCDDKVNDEQSLALRRYFKGKLDGSDRVLYRRAAAGFFQDGGNVFDFDVERVESTGINFAAKNPRGFFPGQLSQVERIGRGRDFLPSGSPKLEPESGADKNFVNQKFDLTEVADGFPVILNLNLQDAARVLGADESSIQP
jgi:hypothetical protein